MTTFDALNRMLETKGRIFGVEFNPRRLTNGQRTVRRMACRIGVHNVEHGSRWEDWDGTPTSTFYLPQRNLVLVWEPAASSYKYLPIERLLRVKFDGQEWEEITHE